MKVEELIKDLDPVSIIEFKNYLLENLTELCCQKNSNSKIIFSHRQEDLFCKKCGCKFYKNGKTKTGVQKYICPGCKNTISETTDTIIHCSKLPRIIVFVSDLFLIFYLHRLFFFYIYFY